MKCNRIRSAQWTVQNNKNTNCISNITQGHTYGKKRRNKSKMCNEINKYNAVSYEKKELEEGVFRWSSGGKKTALRSSSANRAGAG